MLFGLFGCKDRSDVPIAGLAFTVEHIFYIKAPVDRVILVGVVSDGQVSVGDSLIVHCREGQVPVVVDGIETPQGDLKRASKGQQVGLRLSGIRKDQATTGDRVVRGQGS